MTFNSLLLVIGGGVVIALGLVGVLAFRPRKPREDVHGEDQSEPSLARQHQTLRDLRRYSWLAVGGGAMAILIGLVWG